MKRKIEKILIPTDYSPNANRATHYGLKLAKILKAKVILFHTYQFPMANSDDMMYIDKMKGAEDRKIVERKEELEEMYSDVNIETFVHYGSTVDMIDSLTEKEGIDLVVMGTKGETNAVDAVLGSIASNVINQVNCSTLVIPEAALDFKLEQVMFATDFHETLDKNHFGSLFHMLDTTDASLAIVNVKNQIDFTEIPTKTELNIDNLFGQYKHSHHFLESENVEEAIVDFAQLNASDLIVVLTKHYSLWQKIWHKSMAKKLALHSTIPLLVLHEKS